MSETAKETNAIERHRTTSRAWYWANHEKAKLYRRMYYVKNKERETIYNRKYRLSLRPKLLALLGMKCVKCGFSDERALVIDHIKGGGLREIKVFTDSKLMYKYYLDHPTLAHRRLQVLCANCNMIKR